MEQKRIYLSSPTMSGNEQRFIQEAFETNWIAPLGPNVNEFEKEVASYVGAGHAAALSAGTAALHLALITAGVEEGDIVFCQSLTFSASCNPIIYQKATPVFIDSEPDTWNMDPEALRLAFQKYPNPKAVMVVHLYGTPAKMDEIVAICKEHNVTLIEDAAESLGATYKDKQTGTFGKYGAFSFNGNKIITTSGGGMLVSDNKEDIERVRFLSTQARENERHYEHKVIGYNYRMSNVLAGIGRGQLMVLDEFIEKKKAIYETYKEKLASIPEITLKTIPEFCKPNFWLNCITLDKNSKVTPLDIILALEAENIESRPVWKPMHLQPVFSEYDFISLSSETTSIAEELFVNGLCLPSDLKMTDDDLNKITDIVINLFKE